MLVKKTCFLESCFIFLLYVLESGVPWTFERPSSVLHYCEMRVVVQWLD